MLLKTKQKFTNSQRLVWPKPKPWSVYVPYQHQKPSRYIHVWRSFCYSVRKSYQTQLFP